MPLTTGTQLRKVYNGTEYVLTVLGESLFELNTGRQFTSLTAAAKFVRGNTNVVSGPVFWGLGAQVRASSTGRSSPTCSAVVKGKCQSEGCYEPADCKHGFCKDHCHRHEIGSYGSRKYPRTAEPHIGVEIEVKYADTVNFRRGVGIDCHRDGSLGDYGAEYKVLAKSGAVVAEAAELVETLWKRRARVDRKCGMHVHLDVRQLTDSRREELMTWLWKTQDAWFDLMPPSRRTNHYVAKLNGPDGSHYSWANRSPYNTVEIRLHGGTLNPHKVAGWLTAMVYLQAKANDAGFTFPSTGDAEADFWAVFADCPQAGKEYLATRKANGGVIRDHAYGHIEE